MTSTAQLRHTVAHELAHRWQARAGSQVAMLWQGVAPIRDPKRYGYGNESEHQAEAAAFAIHFLLSTTGARDPAAAAVTLDHYELLVPGTRTLARYFALQPVFARHPLRHWLLGVPATS
jgi:Zn-dependent peptidase ImmA (M78 family)